jgi:hypothetical protein
MAGIVMDQGIQDWLTDLISGTVFGAMKVRLYQNNHTPANTDVLASYTESTFAGYAAVSLSGWSAVTVSGHVATTISATATFTLSSGTQNVYGVFLTNSAGTRLEAAQIDPNAPISMSTTINTYTVTVTVTLQSL